MPTYTPVPSSFTTLSHRAKALFLYRHILREGAKFFDERTSRWVKFRAQEAFRKNKYQADRERAEKCMSDARKALRLLERANQVDLKASMRLLRLSYGILGKERRALLQPFLDSARQRTMSPEKLSTAISRSTSNGSKTTAISSLSTPLDSASSQVHISTMHLADVLLQATEPPEPLHYHNPRTVPPILSPPVVSLIKSVTGKSVEPTLPEPLFKPLHGKREANLRWRFFTKQFGKITPPLPSEIRQEMEWKSRVGLPGSRKDSALTTGTLQSSTNWDTWEQRILDTIRAWNMNGEEQKEKRHETGRFHPSIGGKPAKPNTLTPRLYRRMWQHLLDEVPVMDVHLKSLTSGSNKLPSVPPSAKPTFSVSKSPLSYQARSTVNLKLQAVVNSFDRIGLSEQSAPTTTTTTTKKNRSDRVTNNKSTGESL
ncbi:hypothetical protein BC939DRAFT_442472 [Gamsiella multidivaricata]|uniref:uncharacterized protein n=1 Tax=Gamsiella multidivaricata TaxID=101098 RepID=UPI00221EC740|nr:uncharacterized protein BC939DRAFT_442472 [Gamsiella multidivaricata]KAI7828995.1 hypothetical protein BC939DRAFT_442472 [Gamsiella multidivaricata]